MDSILNYETVDYDKEKNVIKIIDQTKLPASIEIISVSNAQEMWDAIYLLKVRGAPAIGVFAAMCIAVLANQSNANSSKELFLELKKHGIYLNSSRPTAVNLSWAIDRMLRKCEENLSENVDIIKIILTKEAQNIKEEDIKICRKIGENGLEILKPGMGILTHCNAGMLATCKYGTATAPIYVGHEKGYGFKVYADETRPLLQGARLTAVELISAGVDVTLACDNMAASLMSEGLIDVVLVGCDRVAANGDTANKIGTSQVATVAKYYNIPFYVCAPLSTIDMNTKSGKEIVIEDRPEIEVTDMWFKKRMTAQGVKVYNKAFDVTSVDLITGFITEKGIFSCPEKIL